MFRISFGEQSPRVTLLQILLNSHRCVGTNGRRLTVDGIYGANTRAAVIAASRLLGTPADPGGAAASPTLVQRMLANLDLRSITSVDLGDPRLQSDVDAFRRVGNDPVVMGGMCNGLQQMVGLVTAQSRPGHVAALRFDGHGNLGRWLTVSVGNVAHLTGHAYREIEAEFMSYISASNYHRVSGVIAPLRQVFAPFGHVEHLGCTLGARRSTREMLGRLANLWGVPIRVGIRTQPIGSIEIAGPSFTAFPRSQSLISWSRQFNQLELPGSSMAV